MTAATQNVLRLGTRGSKLALWQAAWVAEQVRRRNPGLDVQIVVLKTQGDIQQQVPLADVAGRGVFVREIEAALLEGEIDAAVHSAKDMTSSDTPGLTIGAFCERADPRDALVSRHQPGTLSDLPKNAVVATSAPRRIAQLRHVRPDLQFVAIRGNVDTRLAKLAAGEANALVLAYAGLARLGRQAAATEILAPETCLPQVGQACVAVQCRVDDLQTQLVVRESCDHVQTRREVSTERRFLALIGGGCTAPVAAHALSDDSGLSLFALVADPSGATILRTRASVAAADAIDVVAAAAYDDLMVRGAANLLAHSSA